MWCWCVGVFVPLYILGILFKQVVAHNGLIVYSVAALTLMLGVTTHYSLGAQNILECSYSGNCRFHLAHTQHVISCFSTTACLWPTSTAACAIETTKSECVDSALSLSLTILSWENDKRTTTHSHSSPNAFFFWLVLWLWLNFLEFNFGSEQFGWENFSVVFLYLTCYFSFDSMTNFFSMIQLYGFSHQDRTKANASFMALLSVL